MALEDSSEADPCAGWVIGPNEFVCRLSEHSFLALRGETFVVLRRLDVEAAGVHDLQQHAELTSQITHANLAHVFACDSSDEGVFWVSELVAGATLQEIRAACKKAGKSLPLGLIFATLHEAALALAELHGRRRAHGDVRDANLIVGFGGTSKVLNPGVMDSINRMPPDAQTDVFALSSLLYECLTGGGPAGPAFAPPSSFNHSLEKPVDDLLLRALGPDRAKRFKTAADFAQALKSAAGAYMWKVAQRADFVTTMFKLRHAKEQVLLAGAAARLAELRAIKAAERAAAEAEAARAAFLSDEDVGPVVRGELIVEQTGSRPSTQQAPPEVYSVPKRAVLLGASAIAGIVACVFLVGVLSSSPQLAATNVAALAPPIPVLAPTPAPAPPPELAAPTPEEQPQLATAVDEPTPPEAREATPKVKRKKKASAGDAPLPPWLSRKGRR